MPLRHGLPLLCLLAVSCESLWAESSQSSSPTHSMSRRVGSAISSEFKYDPGIRLKAAAEALQSETLPDGTILLPKQKVLAKRDPVFAEYELYDRAGRMQLASQRYLSAFHRNVLNRFRIGHADEAYALARYEEDRTAAAKQNALAKAATYEALGDQEMSAEFKRLRRQTQQTQVYEKDVMSRTHLPR